MVSGLPFFICYKLDVLRLFYRAHSESFPDIMYENIGQNRVSTYLIRYQSRLLVPRYESRYMKDSLSCGGAPLWNFVNYNDKEASATLNFCKNRHRPATRENWNFLIFCSKDLYCELFTKVLFKCFEDLDFSRNRGQFENCHFSIAAISEKGPK